VTYPLTPTPSSSSRLPSVRSVLAASPLAWSLTAHALGRTGAIPFRPYAYQTAILRDRSLRRLILKARQVGISQAVAIEARWAAEYEPQSTTLFISRNEKLAAELVRYTRRCAPEQVGNPLVRDGSFSLEWANGSRVLAEAATRNAGRGIAARRAYLDEFAFQEYDTDIWASIEPTADIITVLSTPRGRANLFYLLWSGEFGDWSKHLVHWTQSPLYWTQGERDAGIDPKAGAWYRQKRPVYTARDWASEFECDFVESGGAVFPSTLCERVYVRGRMPSGDPRTWIAVPGSVTYWDIGARADATVGVTVARVTGKLAMVAFARYEAPTEWPAIERAISDRVGRYPDGRHYIESNGIGDPLISRLQEAGLPVMGFLVTARTKADIIRALLLSAEQDRFRHGAGELYSEMLRYQADDTKIVQDCVMAAAGAVYHADQGGVILHV